MLRAMIAVQYCFMTTLHAPDPFVFVLFGASGNLAKLKIYPALYILALKDRLPAEYAIVGYGRSELSDESFRSLVEQSVREDISAVNEEALQRLLSRVYYQSGAYDSESDISALRSRIESLEAGWGESVRLAYLSVPPTVFTPILHMLCRTKVRGGGKPFRCIVEKPVGHNLASFEEVRTVLTECFDESEIYLLDHYLGKEAVRNLYYLRYANPVLERMFKNTLIHHVEVTASESLGLEGRAGYFDAAGTLRDYVQSHMLLMAALLTMRLREDGEHFRSARQHALEQLYLPPAAGMDDVVIQGQYAAGAVGGEHHPAYIEEPGIEATSRTNTYVALRLMTRSSRWEGVPFYVRTGKRLARRETRISIEFLENHPVGKGGSRNRLDIILQGEAGLRLHLQTKIGGTEPAFRPLVMEDPLVCHGDCLPEHGLLLLEAIHGRQQWFLTFEEVRAAWRLIDPLQTYLDSPSTLLHTYPAGSDGPEAASAWIQRHGAAWF